MKKHLLALSIGVALSSSSMVNAQGLAQAAKVAKAAKTVILLAPDIIILIDDMQQMPKLAANLRDKKRSKADKVGDAQKILTLMTKLQPIFAGLLDTSSDIALAVDQQANADKIKVVKGYVNDGFGALKDIGEILEVIQMLQAESAPEVLQAEPQTGAM